MKPLATIISHYNIQFRLRAARQRLADAIRILDFYLRNIRIDHAHGIPLTLLESQYIVDSSLERGRAKAELISAIHLAEAKLGRKRRPF